jgi:outer membrane biogenesis lipoprotein LolB
MISRGASLTLSLVAAFVLAGCKDKQPPPAPPLPAKPIVQQKAEPAVTREQAMASLLALPEVKSWSQDIEQRSRGKAHGAVIEDDPAPRVINGRQYWQLSFVENGADKVHRRESFLVAQTGKQILVEDTGNDTVVSLDDWRRNIRRVELKSAD